MLQQVPDPFALAAFGGVLPVAAVPTGVVLDPGTVPGVPFDALDPTGATSAPAAFAGDLQIAHDTAMRINHLAQNIITSMCVSSRSCSCNAHAHEEAQRAGVPTGHEPHVHCRFVSSLWFEYKANKFGTLLATLQDLKEIIAGFSTFLAQTGVGALPAKAPGPGEPPLTEQALQERHEQIMRTLYARLVKPKENAGAVADILTTERR